MRKYETVSRCFNSELTCLSLSMYWLDGKREPQVSTQHMVVYYIIYYIHYTASTNPVLLPVL